MKKIIATFLTLVLMLSVGMMFACGGTSNLTLDKTEVSVEKYKNTFVTAEYDGTKELTWSSENTAIAVVDNGMITGVGEGTTKIIVTDGKAKAECSVTVTAPNLDKLAISVAESKFGMFVGDQKTLEPKITYDNIPLSATGFKFSTESQNISVSDAGVVTANAVGVAIVNVSGTFEGKELSLDVEINVLDVYEVKIQQTNVVLYPFAEYGENTYNKTIQCTANVLKRGENVSFNASDIKWSVAEGQDVISVSETGLVTALNGGTAELFASYVIEGKTVVGKIDVTVSPVELEMKDVVLDAGITTPFAPDFKAITGLDEKVTKIIVNSAGMDETEVLSTNGSFDMSSFTAGEATITLVTRNFAYSFSAIIYDGVISSIDDMKALLKATSGLYKFASDIDMAEYTDNEGVWTSTVAFTGTIDGGNHVIRNFKTSSGLFAKLNGGTIKDIAFTNVETIGATGVFGGGHDRPNSTPIVIDNVYVSHSSNTNGWYVGLVGSINLRDSFTVTNSVIASSDKLGYSAIVGRVGSYAITVDNCYLINTPVYRYSFNGENPEDYKDTHDPKTNNYVSYTTSLDAYKAYVDGAEYEVSEFVQTYVDELMEGYAQEILLLKNDNVSELLTFTGKTVLLTEDIDMATAYTENDGLWTSSLKFFGTFDGQGHAIKNLKTDTGLFNSFNGHFQNVAIENVNMQGNAGVIAKTYERIDVSDVWVDNVYVELGTTGGGCNWYVGLFGSVNIGSPIFLSNVFFVSNVPGRAFIYGEVGSGAIDMQNCYFVGLVREYARSLNTNLDEEAQHKLHLPEKNVYKFYKTEHEFYFDYVNDAIKAEDLVGEALKAQADKLTGHTFSVKADADKHWYECSCGNVKLNEEEHYGDANCTETGNCEFCNEVYGGKHKYTELKSDETYHWYKCSGCDLIDGKVEHFGGTPTCTEQAKCEVCDTAHGELHNFKEIKYDETYHWYKCTGCELTTEKVKHSGGVATITEKAKCEVCGTGYGELKPAFINITNQNVAELLTATDGTYYITEDIDMATAYTANDGVWASTSKFNGVIDGKDHTIKNFNTSSGLFNNFNGTIKNIAFEDATVTGGTGVIANTYQRNDVGPLTIENLFVSYKTGNTTWLAGGLFNQINVGSGAVSLKNVYLYTPATTNAGNGLFAMAVSGKVTMENAYFVGYDGLLHHSYYVDKGWNPQYEGTYKGYASQALFVEDYLNNKVTLSGMVKEKAIKLIGIKTIDSTNVADLLTATSGTYLITEDIDMATAYTANDGVWTSTSKFNGVIDGKDHTIKNFNTSSGLFNNFNGTIKNIAFEDATVTGGTGVIANTYQRNGVGPLTIENLFVSYKTGNTAWLAGGLFNQINVGSAVSLKNVYLYTPATTNAGNGLFAMAVSGKVTMENAYFVGYDGLLHHSYYVDKGWNPQYEGTYKGYASQALFVDDYLNNKVTLSGMVKEKAVKLLGIKTIDSTNVADLLTATSGTYLITEDIDMATAYTANDGVWASTTTFSGSIYGDGHTIKNFKTSTGLFKTLLGVVKNIAFVDAETSSANGLIAYGTTRNSTSSITIENIYISYKSAPTGYLASGIFRSLNLGSTKCVIKDCYVYIPGSSTNGNALFAGSLDDATTSLTLENSYFVGLAGRFVYNGNSKDHDFGGYKAYADMDAFNADTSKTLTEFMKSNLAK